MFKRMPAKDPRTVARDIPGIFDALFPQLLPGVVAYLNRQAEPISGQKAIPESLIKESRLKHSMLFEIGYARAEQILSGIAEDWEICINSAVERQRRHFDAAIPEEILDTDIFIAEWVANNLVVSLRYLEEKNALPIQISPIIPGYQWIVSGWGDFSIGSKLIEVKCTGKRFSSSDYRQIIMYWLLSYSASMEKHSNEWEHAILLNPRLNIMLELPFSDILTIVSAGRSKVEILELFEVMIGECTLKK